MYIDEAGDEGIARGTEWFLLGAVVVPEENDLQVSKSIDRIKARTNIPPANPLHWRKLDHPRKKVFASEIAKEPFELIIIAANTRQLTAAKGLTTRRGVYFYFTRLLLERVSWLCEEKGRHAHLVFSNRAEFPYDELEDYICNKVMTYSEGQIRPVFDSWNTRQAHQSKMLQVADGAVSAAFNAFEPNCYGMCEESYLLTLRNRFYRRNGRLRSYGLKFFPDRPENIKDILKRYPWLPNLNK